MKLRCNILYILASGAWGGGEQYVLDLAKNLPADRYRSLVLTPESKSNKEKLLAELGPDRVVEFSIGRMFDMAAAARIAGTVKNNDIDIIHVNKFSDAFLALWAARISRRKVKIVLTRHLVRKGKTGWLYEYLYGRLARLIFVSELARKEFLSRGARIDPGKTAVIHNGIPDMAQDMSLRNKDTVVIAFAGRIVREKGLHVLLEALAGLHCYNFRLKLIGRGDAKYTEELKQIAASSGLAGKVVFTGFTDNVNAALQEASIGIQPSIVKEGFGISMLEYMRAGLAIVASRDGGQAEFLSDGLDSFLVPNGDSEKLAAAIETLLANPAKCTAMGAAARKAFLENMTYDKFLHKMIKIYDGLPCV